MRQRIVTWPGVQSSFDPIRYVYITISNIVKKTRTMVADFRELRCSRDYFVIKLLGMVYDFREHNTSLI